MFCRAAELLCLLLCVPSSSPEGPAAPISLAGGHEWAEWAVCGSTVKMAREGHVRERHLFGSSARKMYMLLIPGGARSAPPGGVISGRILLGKGLIFPS